MIYSNGMEYIQNIANVLEKHLDMLDHILQVMHPDYSCEDCNLAKIYDDEIKIHETIRDLYESGRELMESSFWRGFLMALMAVNRLELVSDYPKVEKELLLLQAERIKSKNKP